MLKGKRSKLSAKRWQAFLVSFVVSVTFLVYLIVVATRSRIKSIGHVATTSQQHNDSVGRFTQQEHYILTASYYLIDLEVAAPLPDQGIDYTMNAIFCPLDWHLQKSSPSTVPMFRDLIEKSIHCQSNKIKLDLQSIVTKARRFDMTNTLGTAAPTTLPLSGVVFHETRCGSTLVANLLAGSSDTHRVYSESGPPLAALQLCEGTQHCNNAAQDAVLRDVIYLMSRSHNPKEQHVFFKFQSVGVRSIHVFTRVFRTTPWIFVYRDTIEILMSHLKSKDQEKAVCLRSRSHPHALLRQVVGHRDVDSLSAVEFCAAHLASLCEAAIQEASGMFIPYSSLPDRIWELVLPNHFGIKNIDIDRMKVVASVYSKGRGEKANQEWQADSQWKQDKAWEEIRNAAEMFVKRKFDKMEELSHAK